VICDVKNVEREYVNMLVDQPHSADKWYEFALFSLKYHMQAKAEQYLDKVIAIKGMS
jgi:tetratricopeptide (TPR) repeat protein